MTRCGLLMALLLGAGSAVVAAGDLDSAYQSLQEAQAKKDPEAVKKLAAEVVALAREAEGEAAPTNADEQEAWKKRVAYAKDIETYSEYALFSTAVQAEPAITIDLLVTLEKQNPKSKYLEQGYGSYFVALAKTGAAAKVPQVAEAALPNFPDSPDLLVVLANAAITKQQNDKALTYANRLVASLGRRPKPEGVAAADWERQKGAWLGRGYWIAGMVSAEKNKFIDADRNLRAALPLIKGDQAMMGGALFQLGWANYQLGKMTADKTKVLQAVKFSEDASKIDGPFAHQAWLNAQNMKTEANKMR